MSTTAIAEIVNLKYLATPEQVQQLARAHWSANEEASQGSRTYLAVLVALVQRRVKRTKKSEALAVFENLAASIYQDVIAGVSEPGMEKTEVNRRATFARTAASTLRSYLASGHPIEDLDPATVSKGQLRKLVVPPEPVERSERIMSRAIKSVRSVITKMAKADKVKAMRELVQMIDQLQEQLTDLEHQTDAETVVMSHTLQRNAPSDAKPVHAVY